MHRRNLLALVGTVSLSGIAGCVGDGGDSEETATTTTNIPTGTLVRPRNLIVENLHEKPQTIQIKVIENGGEVFYSNNYQLDSGEEVVEEGFVTKRGLYTVNITVDLNQDGSGGDGGTATGTDDGVLNQEFLWRVDASTGNALVTLTSAGTLLLSGEA